MSQPSAKGRKGRGRSAVGASDPASCAPSTSGTQPSRTENDVVQGLQELSIQNAKNDEYAGAGRGATRGKGDEYDKKVASLFTRTTSVQTSKVGSSGLSRMMEVNYFKVLTHPMWRLYKHHVDFMPPIDRTQDRINLLDKHKDVIGGHFVNHLFDGSTIFSTTPFCEKGKPRMEHVKADSGEMYVIKIQNVGVLEPNDYGFMQVFNILMRRCMSFLKLTLMSRNYYDPKSKVEITEYKIDIWPGYQTSIRQYERDILLNCEIMHKVARRDTALDLYVDCQGPKQNDKFLDEILNNTVITCYNECTYRITDVDFDQNPTSVFDQNGTSISYMDYYKQKYHLTITHLTQPLLIARSTVRQRRSGMDALIKLIPEFCKMTGLTERMRSNFRLMKALANHTCIDPKMRKAKLYAFNNALLSKEETAKELQKWEMSLARELVKVPARILPMEHIYFGDNKTATAGPHADWTQQFRNNTMFQAAPLSTWIYIYPSRNPGPCQAFARTLINAARSISFGIANPIPWPIDNENDYPNEIEDAINQHNPALIMCIVHGNQNEKYRAIKKKCILDRSIPSQVVLMKTAEKPGMSVATKVLIQMNCKLGGAPWTANFPFSNVMIVGYDVCHDTQDKRKSWGALVASLNRPLSRWYSSVAPHSAGEEIGSEFQASLLSAVAKYHKVNGCLPERIICYRDGVDEGKIAHVLDIEVNRVKKELKQIYKREQKELKFGFIIVSKKINTRIFDGDANPPPGTVIDDVITDPVRYDFYLISQNVRHGSVSPTHFNVIDDSMGLDPDKVQRLTYKLTHMYYNWSGTVRVPAPCQYSSKLAFLVANYIHRHHSNMDDLLYFL